MSDNAERVEVRKATPADSSDMARVHSKSWRATYAGLVPDVVIDRVVAQEERRAIRFAEILADQSSPTRMLVAIKDGAVVGLAMWAPSEDDDAASETADIQMIYLDPEAIGQGIGRRLFQAVTEDMQAAGFTAATLWVLDTNERARRFYEAAGWRTDGAVKDDDRAGAILHEVRYRR